MFKVVPPMVIPAQEAFGYPGETDRASGRRDRSLDSRLRVILSGARAKRSTAAVLPIAVRPCHKLGEPNF